MAWLRVETDRETRKLRQTAAIMLFGGEILALMGGNPDLLGL